MAQIIQFAISQSNGATGICMVEVSDFYANNGYPEFSDSKKVAEDYYIKDEIQRAYPSATSWKALLNA